MNAIPPGIRPESDRIPSEGSTESGLNTERTAREENKGLGLGTSLRAGDLLSAATMTVLSIRPDWREDHTRAVLARDTRPWRVVVAAALRCALDPRCEHPSRIETTNPAGDALPTPIPPTLHRRVAQCPHGAESGLCALCRNGVES